MTHKAVLVKEMTGPLRGQTRKLWKIDDYRIGYVVTSKVHDALVHETYAFSAHDDGEVADWAELPGSQKGEVTHDDVITAYVNYINRG